MRNPALTAVALTAATVLAAGAGAGADVLELQKKLPACSVECIAEGALQFGCDITDLDCQCSQVQEINEEVAPCLVNKGGCSFTEITETASTVADICKANAGLSNAAQSPDESSSTSSTVAPSNTPEGVSSRQRPGITGVVMAVAAAAVVVAALV